MVVGQARQVAMDKRPKLKLELELRLSNQFAHKRKLCHRLTSKCTTSSIAVM